MDEIWLTSCSCEYPVYKSFFYILYNIYIYAILNLYGVLGIPAGSTDLLQTASGPSSCFHSVMSIFSRPNFCGCSESTSIRFLKMNFTCSSTKLAETVARFQWSKSYFILWKFWWFQCSQWSQRSKDQTLHSTPPVLTPPSLPVLPPWIWTYVAIPCWSCFHLYIGNAGVSLSESILTQKTYYIKTSWMIVNNHHWSRS